MSFPCLENQEERLAVMPNPASLEWTQEAAKVQLRDLAQSIVTEIQAKSPAHTHELLSLFVSELFAAVAQQTMKEDRRQRQAQGIAAAKARGVHFGAQPKPLPENFERVCRSWRNKEVSLKDAAKLCGMPPSTFYDAARRSMKPAEK